MSTLRLLIAAAVLAGLGGAVWYSNKQEAAKKDQPDPNAPPKILTVKADDMRKIEIQQRGGGPATVLTRDEAGTWSITAPEPLKADQGAVSSFTSAAATLASNRVVNENLTDLAAYGLEPAWVSVTFTLKDGSSQRLRIGDNTADGGATYASVDGDKRLFTMASTSKDGFNKHAADLREKHLLTFNQDQLTSVELAVPGHAAIEFGRKSDSTWQIVKPRPMRADGFQVDALVRVVKDAMMDTSMEPQKAARAYSAGRAVATARLKLPEQELTMEVHESGGEFYARSSMLEGSFKVSLDVGKGVSKALDDFRNKKLFDFGFDQPSRIEMTDAGVMRTIEKKGDNWVDGPKTMDSLSVQNLIDKLRDLAATGFDDGRFTSADLTLTVVSKDGARTETVEIGPSGGEFLARRTGGNDLYRVKADDITALREALNGVREPAPASGKEAKSGKNK